MTRPKVRILGPCEGGCGVVLTMVGKGYPKRRCAACKRAKRIAAGQCGRCGDSPIPGQHQCVRCAAVNRETVRRYREVSL